MKTDTNIQKIIIFNLIHFFSKKNNTLEDNIKVTKINQKNYNWSHVFIFNIVSPVGQERIFLKIPKIKLNENIYDSIKNRKNQEVAEHEYLTLKKINNFFTSYKGFDVVEPIGFLKKLNSIILKEINGEKLFILIKKNQLSKERICNILIRTGQVLYKYHKDCVGTTEKKIQLFDFFESMITENDNFIRKNISIVTNHSKKYLFPIANMLKGFEVRNIFYSDFEDRIILHDLVEVKNKPIYEDIAQFLISLDLINWGKIFPRKNLKDYYNCYLQGYFEKKTYEPFIINFFLLKEYLRFYQNITNTIYNRRYPFFIKLLIKKFYIEKIIQKRINRLFI